MLFEDIKNFRKEFFKLINEHDNIAIVTHKNPDGDGFAASLALKTFLDSKHKKCDIVLEGPAPDVYAYLSGKDKAISYSKDLNYSLLILVDCHEAERIGICRPLVDKAEKIIAIDHHVQRELIDTAETYINTSMTSAGVIIFKMLRENVFEFPDNLKSYFANCIYTTILNDTDNFINANTDELAFEISRDLTTLGMNAGWVAKNFLMAKSANEMRFVGEVLATIETHDDETVLFINSDRKMLERNNLTSDATSKMTRWLKGTKNIKVIAYCREIGDKLYRISLRSDYIDVNIIAREFNGGGHKKASGCEMIGSYDEIKNVLLDKFREQL